MEAGLFYASTGVELESLSITPSRIEIQIRQRGDFRYTTEFIGDGGVSLGKVHGTRAVFELELGSEAPLTYVRARIRDSRGERAWVQPVFVSEGTR